MAESVGAGPVRGVAEANLDWATALVTGLAESGVRHAVLSPGSRSTPLALACDRCPEISLRVIPDERSAAFYALGISKATGLPTVAVCTSGTAAANWFPAVIEASMDDVALVLLTADRPARLRGTGANQTIDQRHLYGDYPRSFVDLDVPDPDRPDPSPARQAALDAVAVASGSRPGPVHLNVAFDEPLFTEEVPVGDARPIERVSAFAAPTRVPEAEIITTLAKQLADSEGVLVCGRGPYPAGFDDAVTRLAGALDCPVIADPLSGLRWGTHDRSRIVTAADLFLRSTAFVERHRPRWALQFGGAPTSASVLKLLGHAETKLYLVSDRDRWADPSRTAAQKVSADPLEFARALALHVSSSSSDEWCRMWLRAEQAASDLCALPDRAPAEAQLVQAIEEAWPADAALFVGNSMVIRAFDTFGRGRAPAMRVFGNRGASGIDGNVSTILGIAAAAEREVLGVIGDLTLYHDMNGLLAAKGLNATFVVVNNGGGAIFELLQQRNLPHFEDLWLTPTGLDIGRIAALYGLRHTNVSRYDELRLAICDRVGAEGVELIEFQVDRHDTARKWSALWEKAETIEPESDLGRRV